MKTYTFDIETYINYTLFALRDVDNHDDLITFEVKGDEVFSNKKAKKLRKILVKHTIVTYNGLKFDEPVTAYALQGKTPYQIFQSVQAIIVQQLPVWQFYGKIKEKKFITHHIDLMDVARGSASLKLYGARLGTKKLQDLPYAPETELSKKQMKVVKKYCENDLILTEELFRYLETDLSLRESMGKQYDMNFMSFKGAKIAEMILVAETGYKGKAPERPAHVKYTPPKYVKFKTPELKAIFKQFDGLKIEIAETGNPVMPEFLKEDVIFDGMNYKLGLGGVHMAVSSTTIKPKKKKGELIVDIDYSALYPSLIIENGYVPKHIGEKYLKTYGNMYYSRREKKLRMYQIKKEISELEKIKH